MVGRGIGGLNLALALRRADIEFVVLEQAPVRLDTRSVGFAEYPGGVRVTLADGGTVDGAVLVGQVKIYAYDAKATAGDGAG